MEHASTLLHAGGKLTLESVEYGGTLLPLSPDAWFCLSSFVKLLQHGAEIRKTDDGFEILLASGRIFELPSELLLPATLCVLHEVFDQHTYGELDVEGAVVVDVGAYIGDSAVYFADRGAVHVYAWEPFPELCATAMRIVRRNHLEHLVTVIDRGVGARDGHGTSIYNPNYSIGSRALLSRSAQEPLAAIVSNCSNRTEEFELVALPSVLDMASRHHPDRPLVLKMDCEGCELDAFEADGLRESVHAVKSIMLEMHHSDCHQRNNLLGRLQEFGFAVEALTRPGHSLWLLLARRTD